MELHRIEPTSDLYLKSEGRGGGPTDPTTGFPEAFQAIYGNLCDLKNREVVNHPLYLTIEKYNYN